MARLTIAVLGIGFLCSSPGAGQVPVGPEFRIDSEATGSPARPVVASDEDGAFVVVWETGAGPGAESIQGRLFDAGGGPRNGPLELDTAAGSRSQRPAVGMTAGGRFVVVWESGLVNEYGYVTDVEILAQRFEADGRPSGGSFQVSASGTLPAGRPAVALRPSGEFVVVWDDSTVDGIHPPYQDVLARRFAADGSPLGDELRVNTDTSGGEVDATVAYSSSGDFVVVWTSYYRHVPDNGIRIQGRRFAGDGAAVGDDFQVSPADERFGYRSSIAAATDDSFLVVWEQRGARGLKEIRGRRLANDGQFLGKDFLISGSRAEHHSDPDVAFTRSGELVVVWKALESGVQTRGVTARGTFSGPPFRVDTATERFTTRPAVAAGADRGFVAVWESHARNFGVSPEIRARRFMRSNCASSQQALCLNDGRFRVAVAWTDFRGTTGSGHAVPLTDDTGAFWFFGPQNLELMVKLLDGRTINGHFWVFYGSLSNVEYTITVTDTETEATRTYSNPLGQFGSYGDTTAFVEGSGTSARGRRP